MNFTFENQGTNTYLVYKVLVDDSVDTMSLGMITNNKIPGLAPAIFTQMDTTKYIKYNVSAKISVNQFFAVPVNKKRLIGVFSGIVDAMLSSEDYMLDISSILLDFDYIFVDVSTCETALVCLPLNTLDGKVTDISAFFKTIMFSTQFDQTENCDHVVKIINYLNSTPVFSLEEFKKVLDGISGKQLQSAQTKVSNQSIQQPIQQSAVKKTLETPPRQPSVQQPSVQQPSIQQPSIQQPSVQQMPVTPAKSSGSEKKITLFGLLTNYSKENVELYKKQKAEKKGTTVQPSSTKSANVGFAVPGSSSQSFMSPGQSTFVTVKPSSTNNNTGNQSAPVVTPPPSQQVYWSPRQPQGRDGNFGETTVLGGGSIGETTVLDAVNPARAVSPHLIRLKNNEKIPLNKPVFRIGKERSYVDYFIGDNTAISRSHCNFITRDGEYFIVDTNSTNHTFVNGVMIQSNNEVKINHGDKIRLANEDFDFKLY